MEEAGEGEGEGEDYEGVVPELVFAPTNASLDPADGNVNSQG